MVDSTFITKKDIRVYYILMFFYIYFGSNTLIKSSVIGENLSFLSTFLISLSFLVYNLLVKNKDIRISRSYIFIISILVILIGMSMVVNFDTSNGNLLLILKMLQASLIIFSLPLNLFKKIYTNILVVIGAVSLISLILKSFFYITGFLPSIKNPTGLEFYNFGLSFVLNFEGHFGMRNYGIFTEPGMYVCYLLLALIFEMYKNEKSPRLWVIVVLTLALMSTFSPVGLISVIVLVTSYFLSKKSIQVYKKVSLIFILVIIFLGLANNELYTSSINETFNKFELHYIVESPRTASIFENLEKGFQNPLLGKGITEVAETANLLGSNTSTTTSLFLGYGILFALITTIGLFGLFFMKSNLAISVVLTLLYLFAVNSQALIHSDVYWLITLYGINKLFKK